MAVDLRRADEGTIARDLSELFLQLGAAAAAKGAGVVFLLDEVQFVNEIEFRSIITALHRATQKNMPITVVAAGLPQIPRLRGEARSYAERLFSFPVIASLSESDAAAALAEPARQQQVDYEPEAVDLALAWTGGYLFYIQQLGKHAWNLADASPITATDVEAAKLGRRTSELSMIRQRLLDKGLVYATEDYGHVDFSVPRFGEFMVRHMPYRSPRAPRRPKRTV